MLYCFRLDLSGIDQEIAEKILKIEKKEDFEGLAKDLMKRGMLTTIKNSKPVTRGISPLHEENEEDNEEDNKESYNEDGESTPMCGNAGRFRYDDEIQRKLIF